MSRRRVLLAVSGGIAAYKVPELVRVLDRAGYAVRCALTEAATRFVSPLVLQTLTREPVRTHLLDPGEAGIEPDGARFLCVVSQADQLRAPLAKQQAGVTFGTAGQIVAGSFGDGLDHDAT